MTPPTASPRTPASSLFPLALNFKRLYVEAGGVRTKRLGLWLPDGLHIWLGSYGVHLFWSGSDYQRRITFDRLSEDA